MLRKCVLLLKSQKTDGTTDKYEDLLNFNNFEVRQVKTLIFDFKNIDCLKQKLKNADDYSGILFSSPRCVHAVELAAIDQADLLERWRMKHNFAVGEATYRDALKKLHIECKGKESGNALCLSKIILENKSEYSRPFLFPHGNLKTDTLSLELGQENIHIEGVLVYDTIPNPDIENELKKATDNYSVIPEYVVFFSPSGLRSSINHLRKISVGFKDTKFIAIGPVTELALQDENLTVHSVAKSPTPEEVLNAIIR